MIDTKRQEIKNEEVVVLLHGVKKPFLNDFDHFEKYSKEKIKHDLIKFDYFENNNSSTLDSKKFDLEVDKQLMSLKDKKIILIAYSLGSLVAINYAIKNTNVKKIFLITPSFNISFFKWVGMIKESIKTKRKLIKKLGKERFRSIVKKNKTFRNKYPVRLVFQAYSYILKNRNNLSFLKEKNINVIFSKNDPAIKIKKNFKFFNKKINSNLNQVKFEWSDEHHFSILNSNQILIFDKIINFINE